MSSYKCRFCGTLNLDEGPGKGYTQGCDCENQPKNKLCECGCGQLLKRRPGQKLTKWRRKRFIDRSHAARWTHRNRSKEQHKVWEWEGKFYTATDLYNIAREKYNLAISLNGFRARLNKYGLPTAITGEKLGTLPSKKPNNNYVRDEKDLPRPHNLKKIPESTVFDRKYGGEPNYNAEPGGGIWHDTL